MSKIIRILLIAILGCIIAISFGCNNRDEFMLGGINEEKSEEVKQLITDELYVGASSDVIETFFKKHNITYSYNRFSVRYNAIIRDVSSDPKVDQAVSIYIYLDDEKQFKSSEVRNTFTSL